MSEVTTHVPDAAFQKALLLFGAYKFKKLPGVILAQARLAAVNLAHATQPYGKGADAQFKGKNAVRRDLNRVFIGAERVSEIARTGAANGNDAARRLSAAIDSRNAEAVRTQWQILSGKPIVVENAPNRGWHQSQRDKRGRVRRSAKPMIVMSESALRAYRLTKERLVGFAKSGWATCARKLGGTRGVPGWVSRNQGPGNVQNLTADRDYPRVILTNSVRYIDQACRPDQISEALRMQREKMEKSLQISLEAEARKAFAA
jgi:hypothetical protein